MSDAVNYAWLLTYALRPPVTGGAVMFCCPWNWSLTSKAINSKMFCGTNFSTSDNMIICGIGWRHLGCRVVFFHPLVWLAYRHLRWERELACDYAVVRESSEARLRYAECLTNLARWFMARRMSSSGITFLSFESLLKVRVRAVLSEPSLYSPPR